MSTTIIPQTRSNLNTLGQQNAKRTAIQESNLHTDSGNATRFLTQYGQNVRYVHDFKKWLVWQDGVWQLDRTQAVFRLGEMTVRSMYHEAGNTNDTNQRKALAAWAIRCETESKIQGMLNIAKTRPGIPAQPQELDTKPWLFTVANGTINLKTGTLQPHNREDLMTKKSPVVYDATATAPQFEAFLHRIMAGNQNLIRYLQKAIGYSMTGSTQEQVMFFLYGGGANGKSTLIDILHALLADYGMSTPTSTLTSKQNDGIPNDIARLQGVRFVSAVETDDGKRLAESVLKQLTGDRVITARFMRGEWFDFQPILKLWLATNHKLTVRGTDDGIWRRIRMIPFTVSIPIAERDKNLYEKLLEELSGILNWCLEGLRLWQLEGLGSPPEIEEATSTYRSEMDTLNDFLEQNTQEGEGYTATAKDLYARYVKYCEENGEKAEPQKNFGMRLAERGYTKKKSSRISWIGLCLLAEDEERDSGRNEDKKIASPLETPLISTQPEIFVPNHPSIPTPDNKEEEIERKQISDVRFYGPPQRACFHCRTETWYYSEHALGEGQPGYTCGTCHPPEIAS